MLLRLDEPGIQVCGPPERGVIIIIAVKLLSGSRRQSIFPELNPFLDPSHLFIWERATLTYVCMYELWGRIFRIAM